MKAEAALQVAARCPGAALSAAVDFLIPGLDGIHFIAYASSAGSLVVACARQVDQIGNAAHEKSADQQQQQLQTLLVIDLQLPTGHASVIAQELGAQTAPLEDDVTQVAFGGGPHLLLAACTKDTLVVVSLEGLAAHLFQQQTSEGSSPVSTDQQALWQQLAAVHCGHAELLAISWTQQLDGILTSSSDGTLTMWYLQPVAADGQPSCKQQAVAAAAPSAAALRAAWSVHAPLPQRLVCAGVSVFAPSATAVGHAEPAGSGLSPGHSSTSSPVRESGSERYVSVWWPQQREQRQRHYAAGMPAVGQEKLRHPASVIGLQWSPGVLQKDALSVTATSTSSSAAGRSTSAVADATTGTDPGSPTTAAAVAATEAEDHPALMTLTDDGTVRIWVETLVLTESCAGSLRQPFASAMPAGSQGTYGTGLQQQARSPTRSPSGRTLMSGTGSPGAAPSSPRDARAAAATTAALGAAAPAITSYFCMALVIDPAVTAAGAAAAAGNTTGATHLQHVALWARHAGPLLLHKQQRRVAAPVLWLFTAAMGRRGSDGSTKLLLQLHAVRGLSAIVMSAGYGGSLSSTSGGSSSTRPAAVLWGQHSWELPAAAAAGVSTWQLLQHLCCWVSDEEGFPQLHAFTTGTASTSSDGSSRLLLAGKTFATVQEDGAMSMQVHKQLAVVSTWRATAVAHIHPITAIAASSMNSIVEDAGLVASCDCSGRLLLWKGLNLQYLAGVPAAAVGSTAALAWLPIESAGLVAASDAQDAKQRWLAVGSGSMLQCYSVGSKQPIAVVAAAVPAGCSSITSLHTLAGEGTASSGKASSCLLLAVCSSSTGRGSMLCVWRCMASGVGSMGISSVVLQLIGTKAVPAGAAVTSAAAAGGEQVLVGTADGSVVLLGITCPSHHVEVQMVASLQQDGPVAAVAADEGCLHIASASGSTVAVYSAAAACSGGAAGDDCHYSTAGSVQLPAGAGAVTAAAWLQQLVAPCLAVATSSSSILLLSTVRDMHGCSSWNWVAQLPSASGGSFGDRLITNFGCNTVLAAVGNQLLRVSDAVVLPSSEQQPSGTIKQLGRWLYDCSGPLPQYHPTFLAALLLSGKTALAAAVLQRLVAWLGALRQQEDVELTAGDAGAIQSSAGGSVAEMPGIRATDSWKRPFSGVPLAELVDPFLSQLPLLLHPRSSSATTTVPVAEQSALQPAQQQATGCHDIGLAAPAALMQHQQQLPSVSSHESGMLDLAAFGMAPAAAAASPAAQQAMSSHESGMLDLAAFGMAPPAAAATVAQQAVSSPDSGMLDLAAFGMAPAAATAAASPAAQQAVSSHDSGMLDLAAFGMAPPAAAATAAAPLPPAVNSFPGAGHAVAAAKHTPAAKPASSVVELLRPPKQPMLSAQDLTPVPASCCKELQELLLAANGKGEGGSCDLITGLEPATNSGQLTSQPVHTSSLQACAPIPGLSAQETAGVLAIAESFSATAGSISCSNLSSSGSDGGSMLDSAAGQYITAVSLACALGGRETEGGSSCGGIAVSQQPQRMSIKNAAGVAYTLAPSSVAAPEADSNVSSSCMGRTWGLLPGLDASALLWALLSGTAEQMLQQGLRRLQQLEAASAAAAAAAESADAAAFLAVRTASRTDLASSQLPTLSQLRHLGAGFWMRDCQLLARVAEQMAKKQFAVRRNADDCALLYCALGKRSVLQGLYRSTQNSKLAEFLARDFGQEQHRQAAQKNAFVLLGQHRHELAAAFFILGNCPDEAIGVAANEMGDPQLALLLCRLLFGAAGSEAEQRMMQQLQQQAQASAARDAAAAAAVCCWLQADPVNTVELLLGCQSSGLAMASEHAAQLLPLIRLLLAAVPKVAPAQCREWRHQLQTCLGSLAAALRGCGLHVLALQAVAAARLIGESSETGHTGLQHEAMMQEQLLAVALLPALLELQQRRHHHPEAEAAHQLEQLQQNGLPVDAGAVLSRLRQLRRSLLTTGHQQAGAWANSASGQPRTLERQHSSGGSSYRSRDSEQMRFQLQQQRAGISTAVVGDGQVLFKVDGDKLDAVACCPLMSPDVLGRPVVVATQRHGLVEGQLHILPPEPLSPLQEAPDSAEAAAAAMLEEEQQQRGGMFSRLLSQLFDQSSWQQDPTWHHSTAEFDVVGSATENSGGSSFSSGLHTHGTVPASGVHTHAIAAHPHKQLYLTGCNTGRLHLWQFGEPHALATYTPVPGSELDSLSKTFSGLLSFSRSFKQSAAAPRLANWGKAAAVRFAPSGERFAAVGEGGVVATWRLDAPSRLADGDGHGCAEWWHQALSKQGCAVDFVGGSSSVLVVGGRCLAVSNSIGASSNLSVWDTMAPTATSCVGRLSHHQATVTAVSMLPGGWLLAAGDGDGVLSCTDLRMMGGSTGARLLWSVKATKGSVRAIAAIPSSAAVRSGHGLSFGGAGGNAVVATAGADGAVRVWRGADGKLLQSIEVAHYSSRPGSAGSRRSSCDGGSAPLPPGSHLPAGAHPLPATGLAVCEEGLVSCGADGCVRLFGFV